ncbi:RNA-guided endonuclease InsQ/TnpB family protein [Oribacterium sp. FC2011]|uniref:RNA-guided endonuclease InsQ/TnpB family protein n=1 Tax=Oribacterium sp. FC2011 TaxID=1408311 RepID=UPI000678BF2A|nr:RNA-guided endonuclease TnpB family protein [Oribacterium sp. FC2011]
MYIVSHINITNTRHWSYGYCNNYTVLAWKLYNASLYRIRQCFTGWDKSVRTVNEAEVFKEIKLLESSYPSIRVKRVISYSHLEKLMRVTKNPDFFTSLPMQTAQAVVKQAVQDFKNWLATIKDYKKHPDKYLGKPKMPHYKKSACTVTITNQDAVVYGRELKLPLVKERLKIANIPANSKLKELKIIPYYGRFIMSLTFESDDINVKNNGLNKAGIDFGVDNIAAIVSTDGSSRIYKGGAILSKNAYYAKNKAKAVSIITKGHSKMHADSKHLRQLGYNHANFVRDQIHKISRSIADYCLSHDVSLLVLGENKYWKQRLNIGDSNNQNFVQMPIAKLKQMIQYKASMAGITVVLQEESYTSKASFLDGDYIPVYGIDNYNADFSGSRIKRGLYRNANGTVINADINGAANILRKADPNAWHLNKLDSIEFLTNPEVLGFHELNPQGIPVRRIKAA